jgi:hypothetical protein
MEIIKEENGSITLRINRPENMSKQRFLTIAARLEKLLDQLGAKIRVK